MTPSSVNRTAVILTPRASHWPGRGVIEQVRGRPQMPAPRTLHDDRILDRQPAVTRQDDLAAGRVEVLWRWRLEQLYAPVLGTDRGAAEVEPPGTVPGQDECRSLQRLAIHLLLADREQRLEPHAVGRSGDLDRVAAMRRVAQPVS